MAPLNCTMPETSSTVGMLVVYGLFPHPLISVNGVGPANWATAEPVTNNRTNGTKLRAERISDLIFFVAQTVFIWKFSLEFCSRSG
jgi:hypothetical protein